MALVRGCWGDGARRAVLGDDKWVVRVYDACVRSVGRGKGVGREGWEVMCDIRVTTMGEGGFVVNVHILCGEGGA